MLCPPLQRIWGETHAALPTQRHPHARERLLALSAAVRQQLLLTKKLLLAHRAEEASGWYVRASSGAGHPVPGSISSGGREGRAVCEVEGRAGCFELGIVENGRGVEARARARRRWLRPAHGLSTHTHTRPDTHRREAGRKKNAEKKGKRRNAGWRRKQQAGQARGEKEKRKRKNKRPPDDSRSAEWRNR